MSTKSDNSETDGEQLSEEDIKRIAQEETAVQSSDGKTYRLADLVDLGLDKQQAIGALGLIALGSGLGTALTAVSSTSASAQASTGAGTISVGEIQANSIEVDELLEGTAQDPVTTDDVIADSVETDAIGGSIVSGANAPVTELLNVAIADSEPDSSLYDLWLNAGGSS